MSVEMIAIVWRTFGRLLAVLAAVLIFTAPFTPQAAQDYTPLAGSPQKEIRLVLLPSSCRGSELANHDHLYQLLPGGGDLPNRFPFRSGKSSNGLVCGIWERWSAGPTFCRRGDPFTRRPTWS